MSYVQARFKKRKPPPNPIVVGCGGTIYLAVLYAISYGLLTVLGKSIDLVRPSVLRSMAAIPTQWVITISTFTSPPIPISDNVILFVECTLVVMILLGLSMAVYSFYYESTREKESWELYAEEAERQARMAKGKK